MKDGNLCGMRVVEAWPPFYEKIAQTFPAIQDKRVIFTFGMTIYNPTKAFIPPQLYAHEAVHCERQGPDDYSVLAWWEQYLKDSAFRFEEELPAHQAEYAAFCKRHTDRNRRAVELTNIATKLAGPVYGNMLTLRQAQSAIIERRTSNELQRATAAG